MLTMNSFGKHFFTFLQPKLIFLMHFTLSRDSISINVIKNVVWKSFSRSFLQLIMCFDSLISDVCSTKSMENDIFLE